MFMETHANLYGNNYDAHYFSLLFQLFQEYNSIESWQVNLDHHFNQLVTYFLEHLCAVFLNEYTNTF